MIKVLVADDHPMVQKVLHRLLEQPGDIEIVAMETNGKNAVNQAILFRPNVAVIDASMPIMNGIEVTKQILAQSPETRVLIISGYDSNEFIQKILQAGAFGYVLKESLSKDLIAGIRTVYEGRPYFSQQIAHVIRRYRADLIDSPL